MPLTVAQLAALVRGQVIGDGALVVRSARTLHEANAGDLTFLEKPALVALLDQSKASAACVTVGVKSGSKTLIEVADPLMAFVAIFQHLHGKPEPRPIGIHPRAVLDDSVCVGDDPSIHANVVIGANTVVGKRCRLHPGVVIGANCRIGDDVTLYPNVSLYDDTVLGDRVILHANAVLGADGFGYRFREGRYVKVPHLGNVVIGNDVEIGAGSTIDRGVFGSTTIGEGTKMDNLVHIAHNCSIGPHNVLAAHVGIAGSCTTGEHVAMGGQVGVADHVKIGAGAQIGAKSGVHGVVPPGARLFLAPAMDAQLATRVVATLKKLPEIRSDLVRVMKALGLRESASTTSEGKAA